MSATPVPETLEAVRARALARPRFRGVLHAWFFFFALGGGVALLALAPTPEAAFAGFVFSFGLAAMFGISALFHRTTFDDHAWMRFRRLDHVGIYLCIAGGYTPFGMLVIEGWVRPTLLLAGWLGASLGVLMRFTSFEPPYGLMNGLFLTLGWISVVSLPQLWHRLDPVWLMLLLLGGALYSVGAVIVGIRRPDPWPDVFGYHEIWHSCVAMAASLHWCVVAFGVFPLAA